MAKQPTTGPPLTSSPVENGSAAVNTPPTPNTPRPHTPPVSHAPAPSPNTPPSSAPHSHSPSHTPQQHYYSTPPPVHTPQGSVPMYGPPYQYSAPAYTFTPGFYPPHPPHSPPVYMPPWQQQPYQYYAPPPPPGVPHIWPPENHHNGDAKRAPPQHSVPIPPHILMQQQQQQHQHSQHQQFYTSTSPQLHQPPSSYAYSVAAHEHKSAHEAMSGRVSGGNVPITRMQSSPHKRGPVSRRRTSAGGAMNSYNGTPNGLGNGTSSSNPNSANSTPSKGRPPSRAPPLKSDLEETVEAARNLAISAKTAVSSGDEVTLTLQLTSWASSLEELEKQQTELQNNKNKGIAIAQGAQNSNNSNSNNISNSSQRTAGQDKKNYKKKFDAIFRASHALEIVSESILFMNAASDSAVLKALVSLYGFVLYGDESMHRNLADQARKLGHALQSTDNPNDSESSPSSDSTLNLLVNSLTKNLVPDPTLASPPLTYKQAAVYKVLRVLRDVADDVAAYNGILPKQPSQSTREGKIGSLNMNMKNINQSPAGPDPTKVVERSMDAWRRACAKLQGEMAIIVVLETALVSMDKQLVAPNGSPDPLTEFFEAVSKIVKQRLKLDIEQRNQALRETWWTNVATRDANCVFEAVDTRAMAWHGTFQTGLSDVEAQLNNIGLGFGPAARVSSDKVPALVNCSAGVAALTSTHNHALDWCKETAKVLTGMSEAFAALSQTHGGTYGAPKHLVESFVEGMNRASEAIFGVQDWSFETVYEKVLGSLELNGGCATANTTKVKGKIRFEEPERSDEHKMVRNLSMESQSSEDAKHNDANGTANSGNANSKQRRKPRHARMKSSPDELLHLGANLGAANRNNYGLEDDNADEDYAESTNNIANGQKKNEQVGNNAASSSPTSLVTCISEGDDMLGEGNPGGTGDTTEMIPPAVSGDSTSGQGKKEQGLPVVYEDYEYDREDDNTILVHNDEEDKNEEENNTIQVTQGEGGGSARTTPSKKSPHHSRSMSVDGIPFGV